VFRVSGLSGLGVGAAFSRDKKEVAFKNSSGYFSDMICFNLSGLKIAEHFFDSKSLK
jgi:hypothetical protein